MWRALFRLLVWLGQVVFACVGLIVLLALIETFCPGSIL